MSTCGTSPACSTGHFSVRYWPGGRRAGSYPASRTLSSAFARKRGTALLTGLSPTMSEDELELRRVAAGVPRWGRELDDRVLPAEAGLEETHISFSKGCYPGQEPVARLHYRGHPNRALRVLRLDEVPDYDAELVHEGKVVGRVTSAVRTGDGSVLALGYVRVEVPD